MAALGAPTSASAAELTAGAGVVQALEIVASCSTGSKKTAAEDRWILRRLHRKRSQLESSSTSTRSPCADPVECSATSEDPVGALGTLQLRLVLRALGVSTTGMKKVLTERLREAVSSGRVQAFVAEGRSTQPESFQCVVQMRKARAMLSLVETLVPSAPGDISGRNNDNTSTPAECLESLPKSSGPSTSAGSSTSEKNKQAKHAEKSEALVSNKVESKTSRSASKTRITPSNKVVSNNTTVPPAPSTTAPTTPTTSRTPQRQPVSWEVTTPAPRPTTTPKMSSSPTSDVAKSPSATTVLATAATVVVGPFCSDNSKLSLPASSSKSMVSGGGFSCAPMDSVPGEAEVVLGELSAVLAAAVKGEQHSEPLQQGRASTSSVASSVAAASPIATSITSSVAPSSPQQAEPLSPAESPSVSPSLVNAPTEVISTPVYPVTPPRKTTTAATSNTGTTAASTASSSSSCSSTQAGPTPPTAPDTPGFTDGHRTAFRYFKDRVKAKAKEKASRVMELLGDSDSTATYRVSLEVTFERDASPTESTPHSTVVLATRSDKDENKEHKKEDPSEVDVIVEVDRIPTPSAQGHQRAKAEEKPKFPERAVADRVATSNIGAVLGTNNTNRGHGIENPEDNKITGVKCDEQTRVEDVDNDQTKAAVVATPSKANIDETEAETSPPAEQWGPPMKMTLTKSFSMPASSCPPMSPQGSPTGSDTPPLTPTSAVDDNTPVKPPAFSTSSPTTKLFPRAPSPPKKRWGSPGIAPLLANSSVSVDSAVQPPPASGSAPLTTSTDPNNLVTPTNGKELSKKVSGAVTTATASKTLKTMTSQNIPSSAAENGGVTSPSTITASTTATALTPQSQTVKPTTAHNTNNSTAEEKKTGGAAPTAASVPAVKSTTANSKAITSTVCLNSNRPLQTSRSTPAVPRRCQPPASANLTPAKKLGAAASSSSCFTAANPLLPTKHVTVGGGGAVAAAVRRLEREKKEGAVAAAVRRMEKQKKAQELKTTGAKTKKKGVAFSVVASPPAGPSVSTGPVTKASQAAPKPSVRTAPAVSTPAPKAAPSPGDGDRSGAPKLPAKPVMKVVTNCNGVGRGGGCAPKNSSRPVMKMVTNSNSNNSGGMPKLPSKPVIKVVTNSNSNSGGMPKLPSKPAVKVATDSNGVGDSAPKLPFKPVMKGIKSSGGGGSTPKLPSKPVMKGIKSGAGVVGGGPKLPPPPIVKKVATAATGGVGVDGSGGVSVEPKPFYQGKEIQVFYATSDEESGDSSDEEGGEGRESDDEYYVTSDNTSASEEEDDDPVLKILEPSVVPDWAKGKAVAEALERQYGGDKPINPNKIFVDFFTCNLENIFEAKKKKWARNSSGDWMTDRLTIAEKLAYDRAMGYVTIDCAKSSMTKEKTGRKNGTISLSRTQR